MSITDLYKIIVSSMTDVLNVVIMEISSSVIHIVRSEKYLSTDPSILLSTA
jgi:hypothetical protein